MTSVRVNVARQESAYEIRIGAGVLKTLPQDLTTLLPKAAKILLVTDEHVASIYAEPLETALTESGYRVTRATMPSGEAIKSLESAERLYAILQAENFSRKDAVLALGGGVIGDLSGFVASTYYRGVNFLQAPTTLLAQVDAAVGGKVAVNFGRVKNSVGSFYQPLGVWADTGTLATLAEREWRAGLAEIVKYGLIEDTCLGKDKAQGELFSLLEKEAASLSPKSPKLAELIARCCELKAAVVKRDERETTGERMALNLGHTFAHAYEEAEAYAGLNHGEAVAIGLVDACRVSEKLNWVEAGLADRVAALLKTLGLPVAFTGEALREELLALMLQDKKAAGGGLTLILPKGGAGCVERKGDMDAALLV